HGATHHQSGRIPEDPAGGDSHVVASNTPPLANRRLMPGMAWAFLLRASGRVADHRVRERGRRRYGDFGYGSVGEEVVGDSQSDATLGDAPTRRIDPAPKLDAEMRSEVNVGFDQRRELVEGDGCSYAYEEVGGGQRPKLDA